MATETLAFLSAVVVLATAATGYLTKLTRDVSEIHVMVNSRMAEALARIDQLYAVLEEAGITPPDAPPSVPPLGDDRDV